MVEDLLFISESLLTAATNLDDLTEKEKNYIMSVVTKTIKVISIELSQQKSIA